jgi:hypothetical protein
MVEQGPKTIAEEPAINETSKNKKKSKGRGKNAKAIYNAKKQENKLLRNSMGKSMAEEQTDQEPSAEEASYSVITASINRLERANEFPTNLSQNVSSQSILFSFLFNLTD